MAKVWKDIKGYDGKYQVSNEGDIWGAAWNRVLKGSYDRDGYRKMVLITPDGRRKTERVGRLVALMFCEKPEGCNVVNHKNMIKNDDRAENLEWTTVSGNTKHGYHNDEKIKESTTRASKIGAEKTQITIDVYKDNEYMGRFVGKKKCAEELGISEKTIYNRLNGRFSDRQGFKFVEVCRGGDANEPDHRT